MFYLFKWCTWMLNSGQLININYSDPFDFTPLILSSDPFDFIKNGFIIAFLNQLSDNPIMCKLLEQTIYS